MSAKIIEQKKTECVEYFVDRTMTNYGVISTLENIYYEAFNFGFGEVDTYKKYLQEEYDNSNLQDHFTGESRADLLEAAQTDFKLSLMNRSHVRDIIGTLVVEAMLLGALSYEKHIKA